MNSTPELSYSKKPPWDRRRWARRVERWVACTLLLLVLSGYMVFRGCDQLWTFAAMHYQPPASTVVYEEDIQRSPLMVGTGKYQYLCGRVVRNGPRPSPAALVARPMGRFGHDALWSCFLHSRRTMSGAGRLVALSFDSFRETPTGYQLDLHHGS